MPQVSIHARRVATMLVLAFTVFAAAPASALKPAQARYDLSYNGRSASGSMGVRPQAGGRWLVSLRVGSLLGSIDQATVFDFAGSHPRPLGSSRHLSTVVSGKGVVARFDWRNRRASWSGDVKPHRRGPVPLQAGDVDPLVLNVALAADVAANRPLRYRMLENGRARTLAYRRLRNETLTIGGRRIDTVKLFASEAGKQYVAWVAPGIPLPVRLLQHEAGGDTIDLRMQALP
jgi:hypothetical protein